MKKFKMLIALAGGPDAEKVALTGLLYGKPLNAEITLVSVVKPTGDVSNDGSTSVEISGELKANYERSLKKLVEKIFKDYPVKTCVEEGKPYSTILKIASERGTDVIVMGIHTRLENSQYYTPNDFDEIIKRAEIPLILIPASKLPTSS
jgi:nucleotide-binding universal stress UspA family protein